ncbi:hypothetical protein [Selenihalanaerobacter shriftii]|uniref:Phage holin family Hol44, holin superfamily V n=1 Tax=Selenihalanaerobacter shriftii TaxID=142842 RepID=A0A1T4N0C1_9FIRM|nr:hypothetical protein [Selenihalanaerobacter shriftii]SJZ72682.1 hypothetical protein SAMN02745118_01668 [Selenihalanaerobacter shriftii]
MELQPLSTVLVLSVLVEMVTNTIKSILSIRGNKSRIIAIIVGVVLCLSTQIGILHKLNIAIYYDFIDYLLTGIIISRGSHAIHDISSMFKNNKSS